MQTVNEKINLLTKVDAKGGMDTIKMCYSKEQGRIQLKVEGGAA